MGKGGTSRKLILNGLEREISADNDPKFTLGGWYATEKQETTGNPFFLSDKIYGILAGVEERVSHADGTFATLDAALQKCALEGNVSALYIMPDGTKYTASGGVVIIIDGAPDGMMTIREGKVTYSLNPVSGKWLKT